MKNKIKIEWRMMETTVLARANQQASRQAPSLNSQISPVTTAPTCRNNNNGENTKSSTSPQQETIGEWKSESSKSTANMKLICNKIELQRKIECRAHIRVSGNTTASNGEHTWSHTSQTRQNEKAKAGLDQHGKQNSNNSVNHNT